MSPRTPPPDDAGAAAPPRTPPPGLPPRLLLLWAVSLTVSAAFCTACLVFNAPPSPVRDRLVPSADAVFGPWFGQSWYLFGKQIPEEHTQVVLTARLTESAHRAGRTVEWDLSHEIVPVAAERWVRQNPDWHVLLCFQQHALGTRSDAVPNEDFSRRMLRGWCRDDFVTPRHRDRPGATWDRYFSNWATRLSGTDRIAAVRVRLRATPAAPFPERHSGHRTATATLHDTGWRPYVRQAGEDTR
ncbi:DUF5819 family protein [Streptomyces sp. NPDC017529]|uniref:DUF5819 family protein n=1 Tax=Streptomyces sp. NPDC017529 TaxID=3365000 RepID=UPI00379F3552